MRSLVDFGLNLVVQLGLCRMFIGKFCIWHFSFVGSGIFCQLSYVSCRTCDVFWVICKLAKLKFSFVFAAVVIHLKNTDHNG